MDKNIYERTLFKDDDNQKNTVWNNEMPASLCSTDSDRLGSLVTSSISEWLTDGHLRVLPLKVQTKYNCFGTAEQNFKKKKLYPSLAITLVGIHPADMEKACGYK